VAESVDAARKRSARTENDLVPAVDNGRLSTDCRNPASTARERVTIAGQAVAARCGSASNGRAPVRAARAGSHRRRNGLRRRRHDLMRSRPAADGRGRDTDLLVRIRAAAYAPVPDPTGAGPCRAGSMPRSTGVGRAWTPLRLSRTGNEPCARPRSLPYRLRAHAYEDRLSQIGDRACSHGAVRVGAGSEAVRPVGESIPTRRQPRRGGVRAVRRPRFSRSRQLLPLRIHCRLSAASPVRAHDS